MKYMKYKTGIKIKGTDKNRRYTKIAEGNTFIIIQFQFLLKNNLNKNE
jgi:hypothetical protein